MRYYLNTCTQTKSESGDYTDYGKKETSGTGEAARLNAIADLHNTYASNIKKANIQYWMGKVEDGEGNVIDKLKVGEYVDAGKNSTPEPEPEEDTEDYAAQYESGELSLEQLKRLVADETLTKDEYTEITGKRYVALKTDDDII